MKAKVHMTEEEWRSRLDPELYKVAREQGTEAAFIGEYWGTKDKGVYYCAACGARLFSSADKFDSGTGWPSFTRPASTDGDDGSAVETDVDSTHGMVRTEVHCSSCGAHLGHVFEDGPEPTGMRYCINSVSLKLEREE